MTDKIEITEEEFDNRLTSMFLAGKVDGIERIRHHILDKSAEKFKQNKDDDAHLLRNLSLEIEKLQSDAQRTALDYKHEHGLINGK